MAALGGCRHRHGRAGQSHAAAQKNYGAAVLALAVFVLGVQPIMGGGASREDRKCQHQGRASDREEAMEAGGE